MIRKFGPIITAVVIFTIVLLIPNRFFYPLLSKQLVNQAAPSLDTKVFQGVALQEKMWADNSYLPMFGSSELSRLDEFHPYNYFRVADNDVIPFLIGRGGTQSLVQYLDLAAMSNSLKDKKMVFVLSPQWFQPTGIDEIHFAPNYSDLQTYRFVFNSDIPMEQKKYVAKRLLSFEIVNKDSLLKSQLEAIVNPNDTKLKLNSIAMKPFAFVYMKALERKDILQSFFVKKNKVTDVNKNLDKLSFENMLGMADEFGRKAASNNPFHVLDKYYNTKIRWRLGSLKNYRKDGSYYTSPEYDDLQQILDLLKENNTKVLFLSIPVNGYWYDYIGFPKEERARYYQKIHQMIVDNGFDIADYSDHEYDKYFLQDTIHIGWKGWTYIDRDIKEFYQKYKFDM